MPAQRIALAAPPVNTDPTRFPPCPPQCGLPHVSTDEVHTYSGVQVVGPRQHCAELHSSPMPDGHGGLTATVIHVSRLDWADPHLPQTDPPRITLRLIDDTGCVEIQPTPNQARRIAAALLSAADLWQTWTVQTHEMGE